MDAQEVRVMRDRIKGRFDVLGRLRSSTSRSDGCTEKESPLRRG